MTAPKNRLTASPKPESKFTHASADSSRTTKLFYLSIGLVLLAITLLVVAIFVQRHAPLVRAAQAPTAGYAIKTPISQGLVSMEITGVNFSNGEPGFTSPSSMHYVIVDFLVKNNADHPIDVLPSSDTYLKAPTGKISYLTPYELSDPFRAGTLLPGEQIKGQLSYIGPKDGNLKLYVDSIWSGGVVPFKVQ